MKKKQFSKKILKLLSEKPAVAVLKIMEGIEATTTSAHSIKATKSAQRSLKGLRDAGLVEYHHSGQQEYARLTREGRVRARSQKLGANSTSVLNLNWDGKWRIVLLDISEDRKTERDGMRYLLKKAGFVCLKNSVWISMHPFEHMFMNIKHDLNFTTELMIFVTNTIDSTTEDEFKKLVK